MAACGQRLAEPVTVVALVADQIPGFGQGVKHQRGALVVTHLAFAEQQDERPAPAVADRMELRVQAAFGAPDTSGNSPPFKRLAAVR